MELFFEPYFLGPPQARGTAPEDLALLTVGMRARFSILEGSDSRDRLRWVRKTKNEVHSDALLSQALRLNEGGANEVWGNCI